MLGLAGSGPDAARAAAEAVVALETQLAAAHLTRVERRDPDLTYNKAGTSGGCTGCTGRCGALSAACGALSDAASPAARRASMMLPPR